MLDLKKLLTKLCEKVGVIGTVYSAAWTATESHANSTPLTDYITLPPGTYVITLAAPNMTGSMAITGIGIIGTLAMNGSTLTSLLKITSTGSYRALSAQSASVTFSYIERGSLKAVRIA